MPCPESWQHELNPTLPCDWLPERARWGYLTNSVITALSSKEMAFLTPHKKHFY